MERAMCHSSSFLLPTPTVGSNGPLASHHALVVLNQRLPRFAPILWNNSRLHVCADGGANRIFDEMPLLFPGEDPAEVRLRYKPDIIKGDMDSIREEVKNYYLSLGTEIIDASDDQDTTDLHKCVSLIHHCTPDIHRANFFVLVLGALGGRFDHEAGNVNVLYKFSDMRIVLLSDDCLILLLRKNYRHEINILSLIEGPHCGLIPIGAPATSTTTTGLQWDLNDTSMEFGGLISTSNLVQEDVVTVESSSDLLWTISIKKPARINGLPGEPFPA